ncbi:MAG TPA: 3'-5' exonuclease [Balneolales bacterium]|nr:3'-5' exonuclease [Balneolales bacterium]
MYLFVDTETTGFPKRWDAPISDLKNWPRMVQIAWLVYDEETNFVDEKNYIIKPDGFSIPESAVKIHHITTEMAKNRGVDLSEVLTEFSSAIDETDTIVAHNISFDMNIIGAEFLRTQIEHSLSKKKRICTMKSTAEFCAIENKYGFKWPKLSELYYKLFQTSFPEMHNAEADIKATAKCFWELKKQGFFQ